MINDNTTKTILLVEDEAIISIVITKTLKRFGYNVLNAGSGEKAVELSFSNDTIDLVLMDIDLGSGIDGTEAAKQILAFREVPIVFHTSHSEQEMVDRVRGITRYGYVIKSSGDFVLQSSIEMAFELVAAHKKIKESEEHFYTMFDRAPLGYQSLDENGYFLEVNQKWLETLGYSREEVVGRWFGDFLAPEFVEAFRERFPLFKAEGKIHSEFQMIHKNGSRRYISFEGRVGYQEDGSFKQTHCILSDDTERKKSEEALTESEAFIKAVMDNLPLGIAVNSVNPEVKFSYMNDNFPRFYRTTREAISDPDSFWSAVYEDAETREILKKRVLDDCASGDPDRMHWEDIAIDRSDGETTYITAMNVPLNDKELMISLVWDVTERNLFLRELKSKNEELLALNEELNASIEEMEATNEELTAAMEEMEATNEELISTNERLIESEREVERSEEKFRGMFFQHHAVMLLIDPESGCIVDANHSAELFYGYDLDLLRRMKIQDINTLSAEEIRSEMQRAKENLSNHFIFHHKLSNSEIRTVEVYSSPVIINENRLLFTIIHDITDRIEAEKSLVIKNMAVDSALNPIAISELNGELNYVNTAFLKLWGFSSAAEVVGRAVSEFWQFGDKANEVVEKLHKDGGWFGELKGRRRDGSNFDAEVAASMVYDSAGNQICMQASFSEITDRKRIEEELIRSRELLRETEKSGKIGGWIFDVETLTQKWTEETFRILEVDLTDGEPVVPEGINFFAPESKPVAEQAIQRAIENGDPYDLELEVITAKGNRRWVHSIAKAQRKDGRTVSVSGSFQDITDRKVVENALRESVEQFRSLAESSMDYIMLYDKDKKHIYANEATLKVSGLKWDEYVGRTHRELGFDPAMCELWEEKIQKVFDEGEVQGAVFEWEGAEGKVILDWRVSPVFAENGEVSKVLGVSRDISVIKQTEEKLKKSEERYSIALTAVDDGIWDWYVPDGSAFFSFQYYNVLGYEDNEFPANYDSWRVLVHPDDIDRVETDLKKSIDSGLKFVIDLRMKMKSGEWLWVCIRGKAVETDSEGKALRMVGTLSDVTLRKKAEFELRESQNNLARIIENSSELICEIDDTGRYTFVSKRYEDILGYSPGELLGQPVSEKMHPDDLAAAAAKYETVKSEKGISVDEWRFRHKNGNYHTFQCRGSVYIDGNGLPKTVVVAHDITESKQMDETQLFLIMSGSHLSGGDDFFQSLARYLAETLKMDFVCIDKLVGGGLSARTVAVYFDGEFEDNIEYTLNDTPCGVVAGKNICTFEENVRGLFPKDIVLQEMKAESYAGVTLWGSSGEPIGLIAVIGREKMDDPALAESILKMVSIRAAGELERRDAEERIKGLLLEKDILLKEVHHRIKNNMNTINGLLSLQAESLTDPAAVDALKDAESRVQSMMVLYDKLYRSDNFNEVSISEYLPGLIAEITENFPNKKSVQIESSIDDFILGVQTLLPIGIIVNELITNTMKYAFAGRDGGSIKISAILKGSKAEMIIEDNGVGIPETVTFENSFGFGMQLVCMLTEQMGGAIRIERGEGTRFVLEFDVCT